MKGKEEEHEMNRIEVDGVIILGRKEWRCQVRTRNVQVGEGKKKHPGGVKNEKEISNNKIK